MASINSHQPAGALAYRSVLNTLPYGTEGPGKEGSWNSKRDNGRRAQVWTALALCAAVLAAWVLEQLVRNRPTYAETFAPDWLPLAAAGLAAAGIMRLNGRPQWLRLRRALSWSGLLLMVWAANGLPFDLLRIVGLIPLAVDWPGLATRTLALAAAVVLARLALAGPPDPASTRVS